MKSELVPKSILRVFISSAQRDEGAFNWEDARKRIADELRKCPFFIPFVMEESGSELSPVQRFLFRVEQSDIVILLVKADVREGTALEVATAMKKKKPILVFFLNDDNPSYSVGDLKRTLQTNKYCTYHKIESFDHIEKQVFQDLIEDIIEFYQFEHHSFFQQDYDSESVANGLESDRQITNLPTKATFSLFRSAYEHLYDLLSLGYLKSDKTPLESELHRFGMEALEWLILGTNWPDNDGVLDLSDKAKDIYGKTTWFLKRWDAIKSALSGDYNKALEIENEALSLAKDSDAPEWVINDILIDCRNLTIIAGNARKQVIFDSPAQKALNESDTIAFLPVADRYLENVYAEMVKEEINIETLPPYTIQYGSNLSRVIQDFENYFFSSILYGSYSHISLSREVLADVLYKYAAISSYPELLLHAVKLYVLSGNSKKLKQVLDSKWDLCYSGISSEADSFWLLSNSVDPEKKSTMKQTIISKIGLYLSDTVFNEASIFLEEHLPEIYWGNCEDYLQCIIDNITRIKPILVINILVDIIDNKKYHLGHKITSILLYLNLESVPQENLIALHDSLINSLPELIKNNGNPQCIAALVGQRKEVFYDLAELPNNGLEGNQKLYYDLNMDGEDYDQSYDQLYENLITMAREQFNTNRTENGFISFSVQPYSSISNLMQKGKYFTETAEKEFFSLCNDVLSSHAPIPVKDDCIACLCDVIIERMRRRKPIPQELSPVIPFLEEQDENSFYFMRTTTMNSFLSRVLLLKELMGIANEDEIIGWNTILKNGDPNERVVISKCCEKYLQFITSKGQEPGIAVFSIAIQCTEDDYHLVRQFGSSCMCYYLETKYHEQSKNKLYELTLDSSHWVRNHLINLCTNGMIKDETSKTKIIDTLKKDANYAVRIHASSCDI